MQKAPWTITSSSHERNNRLTFLDYAIHAEEGRSLHMQESLLLEHKLGVIRALHHRADKVPMSAQAQEKEHKHPKDALHSYPNWTFVKTATRSWKIP